jgi:hypothetical protein
MAFTCPVTTVRLTSMASRTSTESSRAPNWRAPRTTRWGRDEPRERCLRRGKGPGGERGDEGAPARRSQQAGRHGEEAPRGNSHATRRSAEHRHASPTESRQASRNVTAQIAHETAGTVDRAGRQARAPRPARPPTRSRAPGRASSGVRHLLSTACG